MNLVNKIVNPFFAQNSDFEPRMAEPFANERKNIRFECGLIMIFMVLFFHWEMAQPFTVQTLNFEQKRGSQFCLPDLLKSFSLAFLKFIGF